MIIADKLKKEINSITGIVWVIYLFFACNLFLGMEAGTLGVQTLRWIWIAGAFAVLTLVLNSYIKAKLIANTKYYGFNSYEEYSNRVLHRIAYLKSIGKSNEALLLSLEYISDTYKEIKNTKWYDNSEGNK